MNYKDLKHLRTSLGYKQQEMADCLNCSKAYYGKMERGEKPVADKYLEILYVMRSQLEKSVENTFSQLVDLVEESKTLHKSKIYEIMRSNEIKKADLVLEEMTKKIDKANAELIEKTRKEAPFFPSVEASLDKITLIVDLSLTENNEFVKAMEQLDGVEGNHTYRYIHSVPSLKTYEHMWDINSIDCKLNIQYVTLDNKGMRKNRLRVEFNPNKLKYEDNAVFRYILRFLKPYQVKFKVFDICKDYVGTDTRFCFLQETHKKAITKEYTCEKTRGKTLYFGDMNKKGVRLYNKRAEMISKDKKDIGYECSRYEYRETLHKYMFLHNCNKYSLTTVLPVVGAVNFGFMEAIKDTKLQASDKVIIKALLNREISIGDFDDMTANKYKQILKDLSVATMTINEVDIQAVLIKFWIRFNDMYNANKEELEAIKEERKEIQQTINDIQAF